MQSTSSFLTVQMNRLPLLTPTLSGQETRHTLSAATLVNPVRRLSSSFFASTVVGATAVALDMGDEVVDDGGGEGAVPFRTSSPWAWEGACPPQATLMSTSTAVRQVFVGASRSAGALTLMLASL